MQVTVDDVNFCDDLVCEYVKYKSLAPTARVLPDYYMFCRLKHGSWKRATRRFMQSVACIIYSYIIVATKHNTYPTLPYPNLT